MIKMWIRTNHRKILSPKEKQLHLRFAHLIFTVILLHQNDSFAWSSCSARCRTFEQVQRSLIGHRNVCPNLGRRVLPMNIEWVRFTTADRTSSSLPRRWQKKKNVLEICTARSMITSRIRRNRPKMDKIFIMVLVPWLLASANTKYLCACQRRIH